MSSETKFTPGPWRWTDEYTSGDGSRTWSLIGARGYGILSCDGTGNSPQGLGDEANAYLISAAPDMYEALERLCALRDDYGPFGGETYQDRIDRTWANAKAALSKARGES